MHAMIGILINKLKEEVVQIQKNWPKTLKAVYSIG